VGFKCWRHAFVCIKSGVGPGGPSQGKSERDTAVTMIIMMIIMVYKLGCALAYRDWD
jgi:hypothetical protein